MNKNCLTLLLTSTVQIGNTTKVKRRDADERLNDYIVSLRRWLRKQDSIERIVVCENSGADIQTLRSLAERGNNGKAVEILQFQGQGFDPERGKGYGEGLIMRHALENSALLSESEYFVKVTGRLYVANICEIVQTLPDEFCVAGLMAPDLDYLDSRLIFFNRKTFDTRFADSFKEVHDGHGIYLEHVYAQETMRLVLDGQRWHSLRVPPYFVGYSGTFNSRLNGPKAYIRHLLKKALCFTR